MLFFAEAYGPFMHGADNIKKEQSLEWYDLYKMFIDFQEEFLEPFLESPAVADAAALEPALIRLTWRGNILPLGQRLGPLGIKQYVTDPVFVTVLDEPTAAAAAAPGDTFGGAARAQVRVVRNT